MTMGRPLRPLDIRDESRAQLESISRSRSMPHMLVRRAKIVLMSEQGLSNQQIGEQIGLSGASVGKWRRRFCEQGLMGLYDELRPGAPRSIGDEKIASLIHKTLKKKPKGATHWTCRSIASEANLSKSTVQRVWKAFGLQPHRQKHFKLSNDPFFVEKVRDIVGLYLNPPDNAMVLCVDEKSQIQALERTQPILPLGLGYVEGVTHNYIRHGTTTLFAALEIASGKVLTQCKPRHRHQEFLTRSRSGLASSPKKPSVAGPSRRSKISSPTLRHLRTITTQHHDRLCGPRRPSRSSQRLIDLLNLFQGQHTRGAHAKAPLSRN